MDCLSGAFQHYCQIVGQVDVVDTFRYQLFHTPFAGMVKGAHRKLVRDFSQLNADEIEVDYEKRVLPGMTYNVRVGNLYSASIYLALCSLIDTAELQDADRIGLFSYGSGCSSEFFSGIIMPTAKEESMAFGMLDQIEDRAHLTIAEYDRISDLNQQWLFGIENKKVDFLSFQSHYDDYLAGKNLLVLKEVKNYGREYDWS